MSFLRSSDNQMGFLRSSGQSLNDLEMKERRGRKEESSNLDEELVGLKLQQQLMWDQNLETLKDLFDKYDADSRYCSTFDSVSLALTFTRSGALDLEQFRTVVHDLQLKLTESEIIMSFKILDANGDGQIAFEEFVTWFSDLKSLRRTNRQHECNCRCAISRGRTASRKGDHCLLVL